MTSFLNQNQSVKSTLPFELLARITSLIPPSAPSDGSSDSAFSQRETLLILARTTRTFQVIAESLLYRNLELTLAHPRRAFIAILALFLNPQRPNYVRELSCRCLDGSALPSAVLPSFYRMVASVFGRFSNLQRLVLLDVPSHASDMLLRALSRSGMQSRLKYVTTNIPPCPTLSQFLIAHPNIRSLVLPHTRSLSPAVSPNVFPIPKNALANLQVLAAHSELVTRIIPSRPVRLAAVDYYEEEHDGADKEDVRTRYTKLLDSLNFSTAANGVEVLKLHVRRNANSADGVFGNHNISERNAHLGEVASIRRLELFTSQSVVHIAPTLPRVIIPFPNMSSIVLDCRTFSWMPEAEVLLEGVARDLTHASHRRNTTSGTSTSVPSDGEMKSLVDVTFLDSGFSHAATRFGWDERTGDIVRVDPLNGTPYASFSSSSTDATMSSPNNPPLTAAAAPNSNLNPQSFVVVMVPTPMGGQGTLMAIPFVTLDLAMKAKLDSMKQQQQNVPWGFSDEEGATRDGRVFQEDLDLFRRMLGRGVVWI